MEGFPLSGSVILVRNDVKTGKKGLAIWIELRVPVVCCGVWLPSFWWRRYGLVLL